MTMKWFVHSGAEKYGPWSAAQLREELRMGHIDAFDLVSFGESTDLVPIYEVDELFSSNAEKPNSSPHPTHPAPIAVNEKEMIAPKEAPQFQYNLPDNSLQYQSAELMNVNSSVPLRQQPRQMEQQLASGDSPAFALRALAGARPFSAKPQHNLPQKVSAPAHRIKQDSAPVLGAYEALAAPQRMTPPSQFERLLPSSNPKGKNDRRSYILRAPGLPSIGPFTSRDILTLWYAKKLGPQYTIQKNGTSKRIPIRRFLEFYERSQASSVAFLGQTATPFATKDKSILWLVLSIILTCGIVFGVIQTSPPQKKSGESTLHSQNSSLHIDEGQVIVGHAIPRSDGYNQPRPTQIPRSKKSRAPTGETARNYWQPKSSASRAQSTSQQATAPQRLPAKPTVQKFAVKQPIKKTTVRKIAASISPSATPKLAAAKQRITEKPTAKANWQDGATVSLFGYRFRAEDVDSCTAKCKIQMTGSKGAVIAVFFKTAFGQQLRAKVNGIDVTGTIRINSSGGPPSILVQKLN
jgi:hypothetical protein